MGFHVKSGPDPLKHPFTLKFHANGGLRPLKHPTFHVNGFIDKEKGVLDLGRHGNGKSGSVEHPEWS